MAQSYDPSKSNFELDISLVFESIQYMSFDSLYFFRQCSKAYRTMVDGLVRSGMLRERMNRYFERKIPLFKVLKDLLIKTGSAITGSGIISALMPEVKCNDIDIFIPQEYFEPFLTHFKNINCKAEEHPDFSRVYSIQTRVEGITDMTTPAKDKIQLVAVSSRYGVKETIRNFDFEVVRNFYNGEKLNLSFPSAIANKIATHDQDEPIGFRESLVLRCMKYVDKGFSVKVVRRSYFKRWKYRMIPNEYLSSTVLEKISELKKERARLNDAREIKRSNLSYFSESLGSVLSIFESSNC
jgi:hypothetical protein